MLLLRHIWVAVKSGNYLTKNWFRVCQTDHRNFHDDLRMTLKSHGVSFLEAIIFYNSYVLKVIAVTLAFIYIILCFLYFRVALKKGGVVGNFHEKDKNDRE